MSSPPRRSGFRLPWGSPDRPPDKTDGAGAADQVAEAPVSERSADEGPSPSEAHETEASSEPEAAAGPDQVAAEETGAEPEAAPEAEASEPDEPKTAVEAEATDSDEAETAAESEAASEAPEESTETTDQAEPEPQQGFLRELVTAMRGVAEQARQDGLRDLRGRVDERVARLRTDAEEHAVTLRQRADADVVGIGEWAKAETERIRTEAEARVTARRQQLEQQLAAAERRAEGDAEEVRRRVVEYERELDAYFSELGEISDAAAFAAAAKRMPRPPEIDVVAGTSAPLNGDAADGPAADNPGTASTNDVAAHSEPGATATAAGTAASTVVVKGLTSFGSITAFKQSLEAVDGVSGVTLSLGPTGEFVYRAVHREGFDLQGAIAAMERGAAAVERQPDGTLQVTVGRGR